MAVQKWVGGDLYLQGYAGCAKCHRTFWYSILAYVPPARDMTMCPSCHPEFPEFAPQAGIKMPDGVEIKIMYTPMTETTLFPDVPRP